MYYLEHGAFKLFEKYKSLADILYAIDHDDKNFTDFNKFLDFRNAITVAAIRSIIEGKEHAISWFEKLEIPNDDFNKDEILEKMNLNWK